VQRRVDKAAEHRMKDDGGAKHHDGLPRLLVMNQYYWPGVEATAHLLTELCEALSSEFEVTVVTGRLRDHEDLPRKEDRNGVRIVRVHSTAFERAQLPQRGANYLTYLLQSLRAAVATKPPDVVLCMTDPPIIGDVAHIVARRFRAPLVVISQDVFPEIAVELKRLQNPFLVGALRLLIGGYLKRADRIVAIGETMRERLIEKGASATRIEVIPNWVDTTRLMPQSTDNAWANEHDLTDRFVVMHSGNIGYAQNLDALIRAGTFLRDLADLSIVLVGSGARQDEIEALSGRLEVEAVRFLPYQPRDVLSQSLSAATVHVVGLASGLSGYVVPSRLYGILAVGRPVIVAADPDSETAQVVERAGCGIIVAPGRPERLAETIRLAYDGGYDLERMGALGREYVVANADRAVAVSRYATLLRGLAA
jgi:colanic acid biosynthesis glycosyl transferase WcaI